MLNRVAIAKERNSSVHNKFLSNLFEYIYISLCQINDAVQHGPALDFAYLHFTGTSTSNLRSVLGNWY